MLLDDLVLLRGELARLAQDVVRDADLADVVQQAGDPDGLDELGLRPSARPGRRCSGRRRPSVAWCIGPWCRPRRSGPGRRRTCASPAPARPAGPAKRIASPPLALASCEGQRGRRQELRHRLAMVRERAHADADRQREPLGCVELEGVVGERRARRLEEHAERGDLARGRDQEQLVGSVAAEDHARRQVATEQLHDGHERAVARAVPVVLVEQPEVVDVDEGDRERGPVLPRARPPSGPRHRRALRG